jgi:hypothetical protein
MLASCDKSWYGKLTKYLENDFTKGSNLYPKTITEACNLIVDYRQSTPGGRVFNDSEGIACINIETRSVPDITKAKFYSCSKKGHYSNECNDEDPEKANNNARMATITVAKEAEEMECYEDWAEFNFHQSNGKINPMRILLDNCSTTDIFCNSKLLTDILASATILKIHFNTGTKEVNQVGTLKNYGTGWYSKSAIANILCLSQANKQFTITYDSRNCNQFVVMKPDKCHPEYTFPIASEEMVPRHIRQQERQSICGDKT